jgi:hypothetical protein
MPTVPAVPPSDRIFARIERFQCACPSCGRLLTSTQDQGHLAKRLTARGEGQGDQPSHKYRKRMRTVKSVKYLTWNPYTQRMTCPWCNRAFVVGLLFYPSLPGGPRATEPPSDVAPTPRERQELARRDRIEQARGAGGWYLERVPQDGEPVNLHVPATCRCPPRGVAAECPIHGQPQAPLP